MHSAAGEEELLNYDSPRDIRETLQREGIGPKKRWGQNFLIDGNTRRAIVALADRRSGERLWEIGPGIGALTELLLQSGGVTAFEIDWGLVEFLRRQFADAPLGIVAGDAVDTIRPTAEREGAPEVVLGNLPYRSASPIVAELVELARPPRRIVVTVQKEMADRMLAAPGAKDYSAFSVAVQTVYSVNRAFDIRPACFYPAPEVMSTVVVLSLAEDRAATADRALFRAVKDALFAGRRKTVLNNLKGRRDLGIGDSEAARALLQRSGIDPASRAEQLPSQLFVRLANLLSEARGGGSPPS